MALIDLIAIRPFFIAPLTVDLRFVRVFRLLRIIRLAKLGRYVAALTMLGRVIRAKKEQLLVTTVMMLMVLLVASSLMYYAEGAAQPDKFTDIPASMWWAVVTLTTVGYGDVFPVTGPGKVLGAAVAVLGISLFALPTGIIASGLFEEISKEARPTHCPHCGEPI
jgi:voltage-gated potassium channel